MKKGINRYSNDLLSLASNIRKQAKAFRNLAKSYAQFQTMRNWNCQDKEGMPIPWYTYPAIEYLSNIDFSDSSVLEYGSGNSTLWWAERSQKILSVESDAKWFEKIEQDSSRFSNVTYLLETTEGGYVRQINLQSANVIVVDGAYRSACVDWIIDFIRGNPDQVVMMIFDNADWYPKTMGTLSENLQWIQVDFHGFGPINDYTWTTSVFINPDSGKRLKRIRPLVSICGLTDIAATNADDSPKT